MYRTPATTGTCAHAIGDACSGGICTGARYSCDDLNPCTADACDGAGGCTHAPFSGACDDGNPCTIGDTCSGGICIPGMWCNDGNGCTDDTCDPVNGCIFTPNANSCLDGDACTFGDTCSGGVCSASAYSCDDGDPCTSDVCDGAGGCTHTPVPGCGSCTVWSCPSCPIPEICGNAIDDDCDGLVDVADTADCPCEVQECFSENCPPGYVCEPLGCCVLPS